MKVTDAMVDAALNAEPFSYDNDASRVWQCIEYDGERTAKIMRAALEAALATLPEDAQQGAVGEPVFWAPPMLAKACHALGDAAIVHNVHLATKPHNGFTDPLYAAPVAAKPVGVEEFVSCTCSDDRQRELCLNKHKCVRSYPLASSGRNRD